MAIGRDSPPEMFGCGPPREHGALFYPHAITIINLSPHVDCFGGRFIFVRWYLPGFPRDGAKTTKSIPISNNEPPVLDAPVGAYWMGHKGIHRLNGHFSLHFNVVGDPRNDMTLV